MNHETGLSPGEGSEPGAQDTGRSHLFDMLKPKPEALLLLLAGGALLFELSRRARRGSLGESMASARDRASDLAGSAAETARSSVAALSDTTSSYLRSASDRTGSLRDAAASSARRAQSPVQSACSYVAYEQPLLLGAIGMAAGAAVGASLPGTAMEDRLFGEARERALEQALKLANAQLDRLRAARKAATDKVKEQATERGLTPGGLKEIAEEAVSAAKDAATHAG